MQGREDSPCFPGTEILYRAQTDVGLCGWIIDELLLVLHHASFCDVCLRLATPARGPAASSRQQVLYRAQRRYADLLQFRDCNLDDSFQSCTGGVDWSDPYKALEQTESYLHIVFLLYIAFVFISVWNVVTLG